MTMKYRTPETIYADVEAPEDLGAFIRSLGPETFKKPEYRRHTVGAFGELEGGPNPNVQYRLPEWFSAEALQRLPLERLEQYKDELKKRRGHVQEQLSAQRPKYEDDQWKVLPRNIDAGSPEGRAELERMGYRAVEQTNDENSSTFWLAPGEHQANYDAAQAFNANERLQMQLFDELGAAIQRARDVRSQERLRAKNQLYGGIAELGYEFAPGSLGDASVREEIWNARDYLPQFLRNAAREKRFIRGPGDQGPMSWRAPRPWGEGVEEDPPTELGIPEEAGQSYRLPQGMPYDPADPLSEAAYYGGPQYRGPDSVARYQMRDNPDDGVTEADANGYAIARYRRRLRPDVYPDDRIVRDAGNTAYNDLRPGFYNAGSITGPAQRFQAPRPLAAGMELRPGVRVRNPFEESVRRLGPRPSRGMYS